jgi:hypothetical protein
MNPKLRDRLSTALNRLHVQLPEAKKIRRRSDDTQKNELLGLTCHSCLSATGLPASLVVGAYCNALRSCEQHCCQTENGVSWRGER